MRLWNRARPQSMDFIAWVVGALEVLWTGGDKVRTPMF